MKEEKGTRLRGQPTLYSEEMLEKSRLWIDDYKYFETYQKEIVVNGQIQLINAERPSGVPSIAGLSVYLKVHRDTLYNWAKTHDAFFDILETLRVKQEEFLIYHGLTKGYDSSFARFITTNVTNYREKVEDKKESKSNDVVIQSQDADL